MGFISVKELLNAFAVHGVLVLESVDIAQELLSGLTRLPRLSKLIWGFWHARVEAFSNNSFGRIRQRGQEVRSRLPVWAVITHVDKVLLSQIFVAKVDLSAFVQECDLVKALNPISFRV